tara:strand:+ start:11391 stop:12035 length:645 start_codon:yes stop_codon:yes gene_type:complete
MNFHNNIIANQYDLIATSFDNSRVRIWNTVKEFLNNYNTNDTLLDCGCGNGKNMIYANKIGYNSEGFDISNNLLNICITKNLNVYYNDVLNFKSNKKYNKIIAIATLHHLETIKEQKIAIINLFNSLSDNGSLLVSFWSKEKNFNEENYIKNKIDYRNFESGPNYVKWKLSPDNIINRFYYIHNYNSINNLAESLGYNYIITWELQNWFILFYK